jgi:hypothetical protein
MRDKACGTWQDYAHTGIPEWNGFGSRTPNFKWVIVELQCALAAKCYFFDGR